MTNPLTLSLTEDALTDQVRAVREANLAFAQRYVGETSARQPVQTIYRGGHLFRADVARRLGDVALQTMDQHAPNATSFAQAIGLSATPDVIDRVYQRVREKLQNEPVEDYRIDFEDGYGVRSDIQEDQHASANAREMARGVREGTLPANVGIRVKPLTEESRRRSVRTLDLFVTTVVQDLGGSLPPGFVVTIPKVTNVQQVRYVTALLGALEEKLALPRGALRFEIMVETPQIIVDATGRCPLPALIDAGEGRISGAHFGTYDYTAACGITAAYQRMQHAACQHALRTMQAALAGTGVWISDGSTTVLPVPVYPDAEDHPDNTESVHRGWRLHYADVQHSLANGFYQGWDLHPAQLPTRYAGVFAFFLEGLDAAGQRLRHFVYEAAQASLSGSVFDDAATGQGLLNYFLRAFETGAIDAEEAHARSGLTLKDLQGKSFVPILNRQVSRT
ncbi:MAG: DUF6986 family protein [Gemmatimonadaceae bacterium]